MEVLYNKEKNVPNIEELFFPVGLHPIYFAVDKNADPRTPEMFLGTAPKFRAIVREDSNTMLSCVTRAYHIITNKEAYDLGLMVAEIIFGYESIKDIDTYGVVSNDGGYAYMFLVIKKELEIAKTKHFWHAFVRITNSYDKSRSLRYEVGFAMETLNGARMQIGLLIPSLSLDFSINHLWTKPTIIKKLTEAAQRQFRGRHVFSEFSSMVDRLLKIDVVDDEILPLFCKLAKITKLSAEKEDDVKFAQKVFKIEENSTKWVKECGNNAYAALCSYAEFAMICPEIPFLSDTATYQSQLGSFMESLLSASLKSDFVLDDFIGKEAREAKKSIKMIVSLNA